MLGAYEARVARPDASTDDPSGGHAASLAAYGVVVPRADGYGGQDGIIPPGVAAQLGLYRRSTPLRAVSLEEKTALDAARRGSQDTRSLADRYRGFYGDAYRAVHAVHAVHAPAQAVPSAPAQMPRMTQTVPEAPADVADVADAEEPSVRPESAYTMFSGDSGPAGASDGDDDTLDGFYDSLRRNPVRTAYSDESAPYGRSEPSTPPLPAVHADVNAGGSGPETRTRPSGIVKISGTTAPSAVWYGDVSVDLSAPVVHVKVGGVTADGREWSVCVEGIVAVGDGTAAVAVLYPAQARELVMGVKGCVSDSPAHPVRPERIAVASPGGILYGMWDGVVVHVAAGASDSGVTLLVFRLC